MAKKVCSSCGEKMDKDDMFCPSCGTKYEEEAKEKEQEVEETPEEEPEEKEDTPKEEQEEKESNSEEESEEEQDSEEEEKEDSKKEERKENNKEKPKKKKNGKKFLVILLLIILVAAGGVCYVKKDDWFGKKEKEEKVKTETKKVKSEYQMTGNDLQDFDLKFLQLENNEENTVYSPLSIKYALAMLSEGAKGDSKDQIVSIIGDYKAKKYTNSEHMSLANALFIQKNYKKNVKDSFVDTLNKKYNAEVFYDDFRTPDYINGWVKEKTFDMIENLMDDVSDLNFVLINALAIDMEWVNEFQHAREGFAVSYKNEKFSTWVSSLESGYESVDFNNKALRAKAVKIAAAANRYDIVKTLGEDNIRAEVGAKYKEWLAQGACGSPEKEPSVDEYLNQYIKDIDSNYKQIDSSTDFTFYDDEDVKVIAKDLKEYDGTTLQYIGIMPKKDTLKDFIEETNAKEINQLIKSLKEIKLESFKDGVITEVVGTIPLFKFQYQLELLDDLEKMGVKDVFDITKADLTGITPTKDIYIEKAVHKATIEFSNEGIKASAATAMGGRGAASCGFYHIYDVPVETIDLTFDNPYMYLIRDKESGEVWFAGSVYEPTEYKFELNW